jgi:hypothetical protein
MNKASRIGLLTLVAGLAACSDGLVAPQKEAPSTPAGNLGGSMEALTGSDTVRFNITIDPSRETDYFLGDGNSLRFPAHSLCDPTKSTYGMGEWDKPCVKATSPLTVGVRAWLDSHGQPRVDFSTHVRFVPSNDQSQWVKLTFGDLQASLDPFYNILYCATADGYCIDESKTDPTLLTLRNPLTGKIGRRIKHFSGYNVAVGHDGDMENRTSSTTRIGQSMFSVASAQLNPPSMTFLKAFFRIPDLDFVLNNVEFLRRFSGYMLASG